MRQFIRCEINALEFSKRMQEYNKWRILDTFDGSEQWLIADNDQGVIVWLYKEDVAPIIFGEWNGGEATNA